MQNTVWIISPGDGWLLGREESGCGRSVVGVDSLFCALRFLRVEREGSGGVWRCDCQPENRLRRWERYAEILHSTFSEVAVEVLILPLCWHRQFVRCSQKPEKTVTVVGSVNGAAAFAFSGLICPPKCTLQEVFWPNVCPAFPRDAEEVRQMLGRVEGGAAEYISRY